MYAVHASDHNPLGIGLEIARYIGAMQATVILACRNIEKAHVAIDDLKKSTRNERIECSQLDLTNLKNVRDFAARFKESGRSLDILVNNAGMLSTSWLAQKYWHINTLTVQAFLT